MPVHTYVYEPGASSLVSFTNTLTPCTPLRAPRIVTLVCTDQPGFILNFTPFGCAHLQSCIDYYTPTALQILLRASYVPFTSPPLHAFPRKLILCIPHNITPIVRPFVTASTVRYLRRSVTCCVFRYASHHKYCSTYGWGLLRPVESPDAHDRRPMSDVGNAGQGSHCAGRLQGCSGIPGRCSTAQRCFQRPR